MKSMMLDLDNLPVAPGYDTQGLLAPKSKQESSELGYHGDMDELTLAKTMGFWNEPGDPGSWRVVLVNRMGGPKASMQEHASYLEWNPSQASLIVRAILGMDAHSELPAFVCQASCLRALALAAMQAASDSLGGGWAQYLSSHLPLSGCSNRSFTERFLAFGEHDMVCLAAGFESISAALGATVDHSSPELAQSARSLAASMPRIVLDLSTLSRERTVIEPLFDLSWKKDSRGREHVVESRALARNLGLPLRASLACRAVSEVPGGGMAHADAGFIDRDALDRAAALLWDRLFNMDCSILVEPSPAGSSRDTFAAAAQEFQARQEASALRQSLGPKATGIGFPMNAKKGTRHAL